MVSGTDSGCINHPGIEASARCKQCNTPVCGACVIKAPTGNFCSEACREKYETFVKRAAQLEKMHKPSKLGKTLKAIIVKLIVILILLVSLGVLGTVLEVPVLSPLVDRVRDLIGV